MSPFLRAREEALKLRQQLVGADATNPVSSKVLLARVEAVLDLAIELVASTNMALNGAFATLVRHENFIYVRKEVPLEERAYLVAHELGHYQLDCPSTKGPVHIDSSGIPPATHATAYVEAYGARERAELQKTSLEESFFFQGRLHEICLSVGWVQKLLLHNCVSQSKLLVNRCSMPYCCRSIPLRRRRSYQRLRLTSSWQLTRVKEMCTWLPDLVPEKPLRSFIALKN